MQALALAIAYQIKDPSTTARMLRHVEGLIGDGQFSEATAFLARLEAEFWEMLPRASLSATAIYQSQFLWYFYTYLSAIHEHCGLTAPPLDTNPPSPHANLPFIRDALRPIWSQPSDLVTMDDSDRPLCNTELAIGVIQYFVEKHLLPTSTWQPPHTPQNGGDLTAPLGNWLDSFRMASPQYQSDHGTQSIFLITKMYVLHTLGHCSAGSPPLTTSYDPPGASPIGRDLDELQSHLTHLPEAT
ncbi:hypothetical protein BJ085DRAFT_37785 [Dimargaris cristalligena]|uniref:Uncharacterized protein n=1 Tax=Dimargaris cristalligena TaxID=215637 RepID=A0A4P9ZL43_9FUNG|nr:hypothetical protein BJ085DRAFT_37785 [Dimargaris cristalligena]|eukprot:RKP34004.1 hypothetical protein BJ085DRAFT_37785 [Dimargaris cristalligena]